MKFRDPKTGEVFDVEHGKCSVRFCRGISCNNCPIIRKTEGECSDWVNANHAEAARLMDYEIFEDEEATMSQANQTEQSAKPRICEVLGVEVGEQFGISTMPGVVFWVYDDGTFDTCPGSVPKSTYHFLRAIEHPDRIIRKPRFTEEEVAIAHSLHRVWPDGELKRRAPDDLGLYISNQYSFIIPVPADMFGSIRPGQSVALEDIIRAD